MNDSIPLATTCSAFIVDVVGNRLPLIQRSNLIEMAVNAGFREERVVACIKRCYTAGLIDRTIRNVYQQVDDRRWHEGNRGETNVASIRSFILRSTERTQSIAEPTEIISASRLTAGLLGHQWGQPDMDVLYAWLRMYCALKHYVKQGVALTKWKCVRRSGALPNDGATVVISPGNGQQNKMIVAPIGSRANGIQKLVERFDRLRVPYELW